MKPYTPRKKKLVKLVIQTKIVRIDHKTQIEVSVSIPDEVAIENYYLRHKTAIRPPDVAQHPLAKDECYEGLPIEMVEELAAIVDDTNLTETE